MRNGLVGLVASALLSMAAQGCVSAPGAGVTSASDIAVDAVALNDAFGRAMNGQILLNALRARDRWPRQYVKFTGISTQPTLGYTMGVTLSPLPFNNAPGPFRGSQGPLSRTQESAYNYGIEPLSSEEDRKLLRPLQGDVFKHYWTETGWPRDVLLLVMASGLERVNAAAAPPSTGDGVLWNNFTRGSEDDSLGCEAGNFPVGATWPAADGDTQCAFFRIVHQMVAYEHRRRGSVSLRPGTEVKCPDAAAISIDAEQAELIAAMNTAVQNSAGRMRVQLQAAGAGNARPRLQLQQCPEAGDTPVLLDIKNAAGVVEATYRVRLRSIDQMIYAMGALLRPARGGGERLLGRGPCDGPDGYCANAPLFTAREGFALSPHPYAARVDYQGDRYVAGPAVLDERRDNDLTASVLTLLAQLFTLNVAASTTPPPQRNNNN